MPHTNPAASPSQSASRRPVWLVPLVVVVVAAGLILVSLLAQRSDDGSDGAGGAADPTDDEPAATVVEPTEEPLPDMARREAGDPMAAGPADAPVSLVVYSDYQCPYCAAWTEQTQPTMLEHAEAGDLRIEWRDLNVFGTESLAAARAAYAAGLQDHYAEYHDALFAGGEHRPASELDEESLVELAGDLGLDVDQFTTDLASDEVAEGVDAGVEESQQLGIYSTPAFLLDGTPILGAQPTDVFEQAFEDALAESAG